MLGETEIRERLEYHIASYLHYKTDLEFLESKKPSKSRDRWARMMGQHGYGNRLSEWEEVAKVPRYWMIWHKGASFVLAELLGEEVSALWKPEDYIEKHKEHLGPILRHVLKLLELGPEKYLYAMGVYCDIPPKRRKSGDQKQK